MGKKFVRPFLCLVVSVFLISGISFAKDVPLKKIFILHSYENQHICGQPQHDGVIESLAKKGFVVGKNIELEIYYMDTKRKNNTPALVNEQAEIALQQIKKFQPDVLVTLDDNAFRTVAMQFIDTPMGIVFSGMNAQPEDYSKEKKFLQTREKPGHNVTGVYEKLHIADAVRIQQKIFPDLKKISILTDLSPTGKAITRQVKIELSETKIPVEFEITIVKSWEEYQVAIRKINNQPEVGTIYPVALLLKDSKGKTYTAPEIFRWTIKNIKKPDIALNHAFTRLGLFGGAAVDFKAMGMEAGEMVTEILQGKSPGEIGIRDAERYALVFNMDRIKQLGVRIPEDILLAADEIITGK
jgi:ABC-type uncharacterized transport system substrate-binding protein